MLVNLLPTRYRSSSLTSFCGVIKQNRIDTLKYTFVRIIFSTFFFKILVFLLFKILKKNIKEFYFWFLISSNYVTFLNINMHVYVHNCRINSFASITYNFISLSKKIYILFNKCLEIHHRS